MPENWLLAGGAERAARPVNRKIGRQPINTDIKEGAYDCAEDENEYAEKKFVSLGHRSAVARRLLEA